MPSAHTVSMPASLAFQSNISRQAAAILKLSQHMLDNVKAQSMPRAAYYIKGTRTYIDHLSRIIKAFDGVSLAVLKPVVTQGTIDNLLDAQANVMLFERLHAAPDVREVILKLSDPSFSRACMNAKEGLRFMGLRINSTMPEYLRYKSDYRISDGCGFYGPLLLQVLQMAYLECYDAPLKVEYTYSKTGTLRECLINAHDTDKVRLPSYILHASWRACKDVMEMAVEDYINDISGNTELRLSQRDGHLTALYQLYHSSVNLF